jgi:hypothetical protein
LKSKKKIKVYLNDKMASCAAPNCNNSGRKGSKMHQMPSDTKIAEKWRDFLTKLGATKINQNTRLCEKHFPIDENGIRSKIPVYGDSIKVNTN